MGTAEGARAGDGGQLGRRGGGRHEKRSAPPLDASSNRVVEEQRADVVHTDELELYSTWHTT